LKFDPVLCGVKLFALDLPSFPALPKTFFPRSSPALPKTLFSPLFPFLLLFPLLPQSSSKANISMTR
ncbi:TPA: hypothetical protein ACX6QX_003757, partial [Photobacterium damselae]